MDRAERTVLRNSRTRFAPRFERARELLISILADVAAIDTSESETSMGSQY
jgi:hypothetical protein